MLFSEWKNKLVWAIARKLESRVKAFPAFQNIDKVSIIAIFHDSSNGLFDHGH